MKSSLFIRFSYKLSQTNLFNCIIFLICFHLQLIQSSRFISKSRILIHSNSISSSNSDRSSISSYPNSSNNLTNQMDFLRSHSKRASNLNTELLSAQVNIRYRIRADRKSLITCEVGAQDHSNSIANNNLTEFEQKSAIYLICPQLPTSICYMDCTPSCLFNEHGCMVPTSISRVIEDCKQERVNGTTFRYHYTINMEGLDRNGQWNCEYRGQRAPRPLELQAAEPKPSTTSTRRILTSTTTTRSVNGVPTNVKRPTNRNKHNDPNSRQNSSPSSHPGQSTYSNNDSGQNQIDQHQTYPKDPNQKNKDSNRIPARRTVSDFHDSTDHENSSELGDDLEEKQVILAQRQELFKSFELKITRPELVISLIGILAISLIVNIILSVRCALVKNYIDDVSKGKENPRLGKLLCLDLNLFYPNKYNLKSNQSNPQNLVMDPNAPNLSESKSNFTNYSPGLDELVNDGMLLYATGSIPQPNGRLSNFSNSYNRPIATHAIMSGSNIQSSTNGYISNHGGLGTNSVRSDQIFRRLGLLNYPLNGCTTTTNCMTSANLIDHGCLVGVGPNGSLTGSLIMSQDSTSFTDATGTGNVNSPTGMMYASQTGQCGNQLHYGLSGELQQQLQQQQQHIQQIDRLSSEGMNDMDHPDLCNSTNETRSPRSGTHHMDHTNCMYRNGFMNESISNGINNTSEHFGTNMSLQSSQIPSCMTPVVVRFPSGESGLLFCPTRSSSEGYQTESLVGSKTSNLVRASLEFNDVKLAVQNDHSVLNPDPNKSVESMARSNSLNPTSSIALRNTQLCTNAGDHTSLASTTGTLNNLNLPPDVTQQLKSLSESSSATPINTDQFSTENRNPLNLSNAGYVILTSHETAASPPSSPSSSTTPLTNELQNGFGKPQTVVTKAIADSTGEISCTRAFTNMREAGTVGKSQTNNSFSFNIQRM